MAAKSILPELLLKLEAYIEERLAEWEAQSTDRRVTTAGCYWPSPPTRR